MSTQMPFSGEEFPICLYFEKKIVEIAAAGEYNKGTSIRKGAITHGTDEN